MKKKLVASLFVFATVIAFAPHSAQARGHRHQGFHHSARHAVQGHHAISRARGHARRHAPRVARAGGAGRPAAWCGWWLGQHLGIGDRKLWLARNWASIGSNAGSPGVGVVVVWPHHVGIITGRVGSKWIVKSGNDGRAVRERPRSISGAIAFRHAA